ncbi:cadherin domain-containing protein [Cohnella sp. GCM10027633]|uniref:cadherin domain-containing protein n=1 Tax=unclassified Cohnella TaxID=2636738 RepID=UPI0036431E49
MSNENFDSRSLNVLVGGTSYTVDDWVFGSDVATTFAMADSLDFTTFFNVTSGRTLIVNYLGEENVQTYSMRTFDGSAFDLSSFDLENLFGGSSIALTISGWLDSSKVAEETFNLSIASVQGNVDYSNVVHDIANRYGGSFDFGGEFNNIDEVKFEYVGAAGLGLDNIVASPAASGGSDLTVSASDVTGAGTDGKTEISVVETVGAGNKFVYKNFAGSSVIVPNVGNTLAGYADLPVDGIISASNGDKIAVSEVDTAGQVVKFGQTTAVVAAEPGIVPGTVTFTGDDTTINIGQVIHDGDYGSTDIVGILLDIFNATSAAPGTPTGSFVYVKDLYANHPGDQSVVVPMSESPPATTTISNPPDYTIITSNDGSSFSFKSIYVYDYQAGESKIKFEGFRDGVSTGSVILDINRTNYMETFTNSNGLTASIFQNVDEIRMSNADPDYARSGSYGSFNDIEIGEPVIESSDNEAPTDIVLSSNSIAENASANTTVGTLTATDPNSSSTFTYSLVSGTGSDDNASFNINGNALRATSAFDYETKNSYSVRIRVTDNGTPGLTYEEAFTINVTNVNEAPTDIALSSNSIAENSAANTTVGTLSASDVDASSTFTYELVSGTGSDDNASFNISGNALRATSAFDYETKNSYSVRIRVTDNGTPGLTYEEAFTIGVTDVNEAPSDIALSSSSIAEDAAANTMVGTLSATDVDASSTFTYSLVSGTGSDDNASFNISGNELRATNAFDYETKNSYSVRIRVTDNGTPGLTYEEAFTISVTGVNEAPTDIVLSSNSIAENASANTTVGTLTATDPNSSSTFTYSLVSGTGSDDNSSFNISGNALRATNAFDYEMKNSYSVRIRVTDNGTPGLTYEEAFTISVTDVNEAPTDIALSSNSIAEDAAANTTVGTLSATDADASSTFTYSLVSGTGSDDNASFNIIGNALRATSAFDYETKNSYSVRIRVTDNGTPGLTYEEAFTIGVTDVNEAPSDIALSSSSIAEDAAANTMVGTLSATDVDASSTFTYSLVSGTGSDDNASFNISGNELRATNAFDYETKNSYSVRIRVTDNGTPGLTYEEVFTISVTGVNEAPTDIVLSSNSIAENASANTTVGTLTATDPNSSSTFTYSLVSGTGSDDNASFNISGNALRASDAFDYETKNSYSVRIRVTDNGTPGLTYEEAFTISVTDVNENIGSGFPPVTTPVDTGVDVLVNGKIESAGTATKGEVNGQQVITIAVDENKLQQRLQAEGNGATITIPVSTGNQVVIGELNGRMVKNMEDQQAIVEIRTAKASYILPAGQINIDAISDRYGTNLALQDIKVKIEISEPVSDTIRVVEDAANVNGLTLVVPPLNFKVSSVYGDRTEEISKFTAYVERMVAIPEGIDPNRITTGVVVEPDGTVRHVPTKVVQIDGMYYAKINSLTNSTYSVVWHPLAFADMANHWASDAVNNMGSRMVVQGAGDGMFNPDRDITRAEFAAIVVKGLGLRLEKGPISFEDVKQSDWYGSAVQTAYEYRLINGFEDGTFRPNDKITREQAMQIVANAMNLTGLSDRVQGQPADVMLHSYRDADDVAAWAAISTSKSVQAGVVTGRSGNKLSPKANITRAEVAVIVERLLEKSDLI